MIDKALKLLEEGELLLFSIAIVFAMILNIEKIMSFLDSRKKQRIELLKEAIEIPEIKEDLKSHFKNEIENEYFRLVHKVTMDKNIRELALEKYELLGGKVAFRHFKRASSHFVIVDGKLEIKITKFDWFSFYYNLIAGFAVVIFGFVFFVVQGIIMQAAIIKSIVWIIVGVFSMLIGLWMISEVISVISAKKILKAE